jgi:CRP/FNR family cyclic AMP-dependent transcriptional regulator
MNTVLSQKDQSTFVAALSRVESFSHLPADSLVRLAREAAARTFVMDEVILRQGDLSDGMHVIVSGLVQVARSLPEYDLSVVLAELGPGDIFGEMGVLDGQPRSATVTAILSTETLELRNPALTHLLLQNPEAARALLSLLSHRLRSTDELAMRVLRDHFAQSWRPGSVSRRRSRPPSAVVSDARLDLVR